MAETKQQNTFGKSPMSNIASPDELNHYLKVTNPSAWALLLAALLLIFGILIWAIVAIVPVTVHTTGVTLDGSKVYCWVDEDTAKKIRTTGARAIVSDVDAKSVEANDLPMSSSEVVSYLGSDYVTRELDLKDWNYLVIIELEQSARHSDYTIESEDGAAMLVPVSIVVYEENPIKIVFKDR